MPIDFTKALDALAEEVSEIAEAKGFWETDMEDEGVIPTKLALIHSEVSEALSVHRNEYDDSDEDAATGMTEWQEDAFTEELADILIRVLDVSGYYGLDIGRITISKIEKNKDRPFKHGRRY